MSAYGRDADDIIRRYAALTKNNKVIELANNLENLDQYNRKTLFRSLALFFHPDRNPGNQTAEDIFKDITAYFSHNERDISNGKDSQKNITGFTDYKNGNEGQRKEDKIEEDLRYDRERLNTENAGSSKKSKKYPIIKEYGKGNRIYAGSEQEAKDTIEPAFSDIDAAGIVLDQAYPGWRTDWIKNGKLSRGYYKKLQNITKKIENWGELRENDPEFAIAVLMELAKRKLTIEEAYEGLKVMSRTLRRDWKEEPNILIKGKRMDQFPFKKKRQKENEPPEQEPPEQEPPERRLLPPGPERRLLPPGPEQEPPERRLLPPPPQEETPCPAVIVIVNSSPMQEVHVKVEVALPARGNPVTFDEIYNILHQAYSEDFSNHHTSEIMNVLIPAYLIYINVVPRPPRNGPPPSAEAQIRAALIALIGDPPAIPDGVLNPTIQGRIIRLLLDRYYDIETEFISLDQWRQRYINANQAANIPFGLKRPPNYLAIHPRDNPTVIDRNTYTYFELEIPAGCYRFTADSPGYIGSHPGNESGGEDKAAFRCWEITSWGNNPITAMIHDIGMTLDRKKTDSRYIRSVRQNVVTYWDNVLEIEIREPIKLLALYGQEGKVGEGEREAAKRAAGTNTYQRGGATANRGSGFGGTVPKNVGGIFARSGIRNRTSKEVKPRKLEKDPFKLAAVNKGKRILNRYAKAEYTREFVPRQRRFRQRMQEVRAQGRAAVRARANLYRLITANQRRAKQLAGVGVFNKSDGDMLNAAKALFARDSGTDPATADALQRSHDILQNYLNSKEKYYKDYTEEMSAATAHLKEYLANKSVSVAITIARQYRMPVNSSDEDELKQALVAYSAEIAENLSARDRTMLNSAMRGLGTMSRSLETFGAAGNNILYNLWSFITGPWTMSTILVIIQFWFVFTYVGYTPQILYIMPIISGAFTFILNFADTMRPFDWLTHFMCGAAIGYSAALLLIALGAPKWGFIGGTNTFAFWIAWLILSFIGIFQFYQTGGNE